MRAWLIGAFVLAGLGGPAGVAAASSLPAADVGDRPKLGLGVGAGFGWRPGGSVAVDWPVTDGVAVGGALASTFTGGATFDLRGVYRFVEGSREGPSIAGIVGLWGATGGLGPDPRFTLGVPIAPSIGFGLAYSPLDKLALRLNLAYSPFFAYGTETLGFIGGPPSTGIEAAYALGPGLEVTAGLNGNGDILGVSYLF
jgi:hypothetical protein